jgi:hypothetical protein
MCTYSQTSILLFVQVDSFVKIFPNVSHGWTLRYDTEDPEAVKAAEEAHQIILEWFVKWIRLASTNPSFGPFW